MYTTRAINFFLFMMTLRNKLMNVTLLSQVYICIRLISWMKTLKCFEFFFYNSVNAFMLIKLEKSLLQQPKLVNINADSALTHMCSTCVILIWKFDAMQIVSESTTGISCTPCCV